MKRLLIPVSVYVVLAYVALMVATGALLEFPAAVVCERGTTPDVEVSSTRIHGYFEEQHIGPCVAYIHHNRAMGGD